MRFVLRRVQRFLSQPFFVAEQFTGLKGVLVPIDETIRGFNMIMDGELDDLPEAAFNLVGTIDDAIACCPHVFHNHKPQAQRGS